MKKATEILAIVLALTLALSATSISSFAAESDQTMKVAKEYPQDFLLTIPDGTQELDEGKEFTVSAYAFLDFGKELSVSVTSKNTWELKDAKYAENSKGIAYEIMVDDRVLTEKTEEILSVPYDADGHIKETALIVKSVATPKYAGTYEDILTFTTAVRNASKTPETVQAANVIATPNSTKALADFSINDLRDTTFFYLNDDEELWYNYEIRIEDESEQGYEVLYTSGLVEPGLHVKDINLSRGLDEGIYDAVLHVGAAITENGVQTALEGFINIPIKILVDESACNSAPTPIAVVCYQVFAEANSTSALVDWRNEEDSEQYLSFEIRLPDDSEQGYEVLYKSGLLAPGESISDIKLTRELEAGVYDIVLHYDAYQMDENKTASGGSDDSFEMLVVDESESGLIRVPMGFFVSVSSLWRASDYC